MWNKCELAGDNLREEDEELWHWCHGAPGVIHLLARAFHHFKDEKYLKVHSASSPQSCRAKWENVKAALVAGEGIWERGLLKKGPGICHGVAGNAYAFLLLHQLQPDVSRLLPPPPLLPSSPQPLLPSTPVRVQEPKHLSRALAFARFMDSPTFK